MLPHQLEVGRAYYQVTYADRDWTIPGVEPLMYVGVNVFDSDAESPTPVYTFQDTVSYFRFGSFVSYAGPVDLMKEGLLTYSFSEEQVLALEDLEGAARAVQESLRRARSGEKR
jgi:hypothetical protein